ncbi:MAG TPA: hypothetical protein VL326_36160 [Kofleriaceae bacterium]|nr:hypothetical protein [Kofleriaceae bacterium]
MSESWKKLCLDLPCSKRVVIEPVYKTQWIETKIDGNDVVIQTWKGHIPRGVPGMPGGIGGEVGIYRKEPGRKIPSVLELPALEQFPATVQPLVKTYVSKIIGDLIAAAEQGVELWWPFPQLNAQIDMWFTNPATGHEFFAASPSEPAGGYWMSRWMNYGSYVNYLGHEHLKVPRWAHEFVMEFGIKGNRFRWEHAADPIHRF